MSHSADPPHPPFRRRLREPAGPDDGFTLLEIVVALGVLTIVMVALLPQLIVGIKASGTARLVTQAKGVSQGELERMRNLPFHIAPAAGDFVDVLDYYYPDLGAPPTTPTCKAGGSFVAPAVGWAGFVSAGSGARCSYEPATGAFYRSVKLVPAASGIGSFTVVVDTQFVSGATPPKAVSPPAGYDTQTVGKDRPASSQIGATVTVLYTDRGTLRPVSTYTQISQRLPSTTRVRSEVDVRAVEVGSVTPDRVPLSLSAGLLNVTGSVSYASTVNAALAATSAGLATGEQDSGASANHAAPPSQTTTATPKTPGLLSVGGCAYACWGSSLLSGFTLSADDGLPTAGDSVSPVSTLVTDTSNGGLSFGNSPLDGYREGLKLTPPLLRLDSSAAAVPSGLAGCAPGTTGPSSYVSATGYLRTTAVDDTSASSVVESCAVARTTPVELFPTTFAPRGVVRITLERASTHCVVQGGAHAPSISYDYRAVVDYYNGDGYTTAATIAPGVTGDPLESVPMSTSVGDGKTLGDYIASWSSLTDDKVTRTAAAGVAKVTLPGVVTIASQPVRPHPTVAGEYDETSVVSLTVGALDCTAEDAR